MSFYKSTVASITLSEAAKERILQNLQSRQIKQTTFFSRTKVGLAVALSVVMIFAIGFPAIWYGFGIAGFNGQEIENWVSLAGGGDIVDNCEYNPDGLFGYFTVGHKIFYEVGERFTLTFKILSGHELEAITYEGHGFSLISLNPVSTGQDRNFTIEKDGKYVPWTVWTYSVELEATPENKTPFFILHIQMDNTWNGWPEGYPVDFYGYVVDDRIYTSIYSNYYAYKQFIDYINNCKSIPKRIRKRMMQDGQWGS